LVERDKEEDGFVRLGSEETKEGDTVGGARLTGEPYRRATGLRKCEPVALGRPTWEIPTVFFSTVSCGCKSEHPREFLDSVNFFTLPLSPFLLD
jgi:hypothetical protein